MSASDPDFLVVGSGLSALAFAALIAKSGRRVVVLEAHDKPGGYAQTFEVEGYRFNAQLHYVWNCGEGRMVARFLEKLGLREEIAFVTLDPNGYDHMRIPGFALDVPGDFALLADRLAALFPGSTEDVRAFVAEVVSTDAALEALPHEGPAGIRFLASGHAARLARHRRSTLGQVFEAFRLPLEARALLALQWPDFFLPPSQLSFLVWVKLVGGYARGAFYPKKHFHHFVDTLVRAIESHGGRVLCGRRVTRFIMEADRVLGAVAERVDTRHPGVVTLEEHRAAETVSNMDPRATAELVGLSRFSASVRSKLAYAYSPSSYVAYLGLRGVDLRHLGFGRFNVFHSEDADLDRTFAAMYERADYGAASFAMSTPTLVTDEPGDAPEGGQILELLTVADYRRFHALKLHDPRAYRLEKQRVLDAMLDVLERRYIPHVREHIAVQVLGSPTTNERFVGAPAGNTMGSAMTPELVGLGRLDHRTSIEGLHFCNASSGYAGFTGTIYTGCRLYEHVSGDRVRA